MTRKKEGPKYPKAKVGAEVVYGGDNVFMIIGTVKRQIQRAYGSEAASQFVSEATSQDSYEAVLRLCEKTVTVE